MISEKKIFLEKTGYSAILPVKCSFKMGTKSVGSVVNIQLFSDVFPVRLDRFGRNMHMSGNFIGFQTFPDQGCDAEFSWS